MQRTPQFSMVNRCASLSLSLLHWAVIPPSSRTAGGGILPLFEKKELKNFRIYNIEVFYAIAYML